MHNCLFLILISLWFGTNGTNDYTILNKSAVSVEIEIWREGLLIHHHIMQPNDELVVDLKSGILFRWKYLSSVCEHGRVTNEELKVKQIGQRKYEVHILPNITGLFVKRYGRIQMRPCPQV